MLVTIVIPVHNEQENIRELVTRVQKVEGLISGTALNILFVDDGSTDKTVETILALRTEMRNKIGLLKFDRNYGHQYALIAGIKNASGDAVITMDGDLQHPPECLTEMLKAFQTGVDVVQMIRKGAPTGIVGLVSKFYYGLLNTLEGRTVVYDGADFRLISSNVVQVIKALPEKSIFLRGLLPKLGFRTVKVQFRQDFRFQGIPSYTFRQLVLLASAPVFKYSSLLIRLIAFTGVFLILCAMWLGVQFRLEYITIVCILLLGGINFVFLAILGKFQMEVINQLHQHPEYVIEDSYPPKVF